MISNRCARKSLVTNCNSIISKNYLRFLVDSNDSLYDLMLKWLIKKNSRRCLFKPLESSFVRLQGFEPWTL